ncbi:hypothetical protein ACQEVX_05225 [Streptomyces syringium]|uniref:hypothetical protein n=1 Tax=Streptomyces syringium TaxID=76729 RepID=UPI003D8E3CD2
MKLHTVRQTDVVLPALDEPDLRLASITSLEASRGRAAEFTYADASLRELDLAGTHLLDGRVLRLRSQRTMLENLPADSVVFIVLAVLPRLDDEGPRSRTGRR